MLIESLIFFVPSKREFLDCRRLFIFQLSELSSPHQGNNKKTLCWGRQVVGTTLNLRAYCPISRVAFVPLRLFEKITFLWKKNHVSLKFIRCLRCCTDVPCADYNYQPISAYLPLFLVVSNSLKWLPDSLKRPDLSKIQDNMKIQEICPILTHLILFWFEEMPRYFLTPVIHKNNHLWGAKKPPCTSFLALSPPSSLNITPVKKEILFAELLSICCELAKGKKRNRYKKGDNMYVNR